MLIYIFMFISSTLLCCFAQEQFKNNNRKTGIILSFFAILIPSFIAGIRDLTIGTDIKVYGQYMFEVAKNNNLGTYLNIVGYTDILYSLLTYICAKVFNDIHLLLFFIQFINCGFIYLAIYKKRSNTIMWVAYLLFLFTLYFRQLNLLRQGIAVSICLYAFTFLDVKNQKKYFYLTILACLFHSSAILSFLIFFIKKIYVDGKNEFNKKIFTILFFIMFFVLSVFFEKIVFFITKLGIFGNKYSYNYFSQFIEGSGIDFFGFFFKLFICLLLLLFNCKPKYTENINNFKFYLYIAIIDLFFWFSNIYILYMNRISFFFGYVYLLFFLPNLYKLFRKDFFHKTIILTILIFSFFLYWFFKFVIFNAGNVYPFVIGI